MTRTSTLTVALAVLLAPAAAWAQDDAALQGAARIFEVFRLSGLLPAVLVVGAAVVCLRGITLIVGRMGKRFAEHRLLAQQVATVLRFTIYFTTFILVVRSVFRLDKQTMLALTGTIAVGVGFALKDLAASVLAGITILFDRPFHVGDRVSFGGYYGEITAIGLRSVRMTTLDDSVVTIPNNKFLTDVVVSGNAGSLHMQIDMDFFISQDSDIQRAKRAVLEALRTSRFVFLEKPTMVLVKDMIHDSYLVTRLRAKAYVLDVRHEKAFETDVTERVKEAFARMKIEPPSMRQIDLDGAA